MVIQDNLAPVGVFDSGVGGVSILRALWAHLPSERFYYLGDSANCPYGGRSAADIETLSLAAGRCLVESGVKLIVVACNTVSAIALPALRAHLPDTPIVGLVPAVKPASECSRTKRVGVLATAATVAGPLYLELVQRYAGTIQVVSQACPGLVDLIEAGDLNGPDTDALVRRCLEPMMAVGVDVVVLGCSHYPFVRPLIERILGPHVRIIEPSDAVALQTRRVLERHGLLTAVVPRAPGETTFATTGNASAFAQSIGRLVGFRPSVDELAWNAGRLAPVSQPAMVQPVA